MIVAQCGPGCFIESVLFFIRVFFFSIHVFCTCTTLFFFLACFSWLLPLVVAVLYPAMEHFIPDFMRDKN